MNNQKLKLFFTDFWPGFENDNYFLRFLQKHYDVVIDENPDYLFYSVYGHQHLRYQHTVKICYTGENMVPDFNQCDYALGFHYLDFQDRYLRFPLYVIYPNFFSLENKPVLDLTEALNRKFCNFVYSNSRYADPIREQFFKELSKYKKVDSGGKLLNNLGFTVKSKSEFLKGYKFTIAFENSAAAGYTTEKLTEPLIANSLPIYWGNPLVGLDFNEGAFINVNKFSSIPDAVEAIIRLDQDDDWYIKMLSSPALDGRPGIDAWEKRLLLFFQNIFRVEPLLARRIPRFGFSKFDLEEKIFQAELLAKRRKMNSYKTKLLNIVMPKS